MMLTPNLPGLKVRSTESQTPYSSKQSASIGQVPSGYLPIGLWILNRVLPRQIGGCIRCALDSEFFGFPNSKHCECIHAAEVSYIQNLSFVPSRGCSHQNRLLPVRQEVIQTLRVARQEVMPDGCSIQHRVLYDTIRVNDGLGTFGDCE